MLSVGHQSRAGAHRVCVVACFPRHGLAHGAETPETWFPAYAAGFLLTTAVLHFGGAMAGLGIRHYLARQANWFVPGLGILCGGSGIYLFSPM